MKKLVLPLLLLLGISMLLAQAVSEPSEVVGYVKYDVVAGNNLIAIPMDAGFTMASDIGAAFPGLFTMISMWNHPDLPQDWTTASDLEFFWDGDFEISNGSVLFCYAPEAGSFYSLGSMYEPVVYDFVAGNNTVMVPLNFSPADPLSFMVSEVGADMGASMVSMWNHPDLPQDWTTASDLEFFWDGDFEVSIGMPLFMYTETAGTWPTRAITSPNALLKTSGN